MTVGAWTRVWLVVAAVAVVVVVQAAPNLAAPPGDSHDGRNAGMWGLGARALVEDPIGSRLGAVRADGSVYANHPPAVVAVAGVTSVLTGDRPLGLRLPSLVASLASLGLLVLLLRTLRFGPLATALAVIAAGSSQMFLTYGTMLDTPMLALPTVLATMIVVARARRGLATPPAAVVAVGVAIGLTSWQGLLFVAAGAGALLVGVEGRADRVPTAIRLGVGGVLGAVLSFAWAWWGYGDLGELRSVFGARTEFPERWAADQGTFALDLFGPALLGLVALGIVLAVVQRRHRLVLLVALGPVVVWARLMAHGAWVHDYWNYLGVIAVAISVAVVVEAIDRASRGEDVARVRPVLLGAPAFVVVVLAIASLLSTSDAAGRIEDGSFGGKAVAKLSSRDAERLVIYEPSIRGSSAWAAWIGDGPAPSLSPEQVAELAERDPGAPVLLRLPPAMLPTEELLKASLAFSADYFVLPASVVAGT